MPKMLGAPLAGLFALTAAAGCVADENETTEVESTCSAAKCDDAGTEPEDRSVCVALRGNGDRVFATFASLARIVEHYGPLEGSAGGSSGSIATFVAESIHLNPAVYDCGDAECTDAEAGARAGLLFKSTQGYFGVLTQSEEAVAMGNLAPIIAKVRQAGLQELADEDLETARAALEELLRSDDLRGIVNPELLQTLASSPDPAFHVEDLIAGLSNFGTFDTTGAEILIRPGLAADLVSRAGSFYAGYEPTDLDGMKSFLDACAEPSRDGELDWLELAKLPAGDSTCGELFENLVRDYREQVRAPGSDFPSRGDDFVGENPPEARRPTDFHSLIATSVLTGEAARNWRRAREDYNAARPWSLDVDFDDVQFGFFSNPEDQQSLQSNPQGYTDLKTAKTVGLGPVPWREALTYSPAEPGIARALEFEGTEMISAGGWPDLQPILALKNVGCEEVVYITRTGEASAFGTGMATILQADDEQMRRLYDLDSPESGFATSLAEADATLCTNWDEIPGLEVQRITDDAYFADLETDDPFFIDGPTAYEGTIPRSEGRLGCSLR